MNATEEAIRAVVLDLQEQIAQAQTKIAELEKVNTAYEEQIIRLTEQVEDLEDRLEEGK
jgi:cell division protein FtsB